MNMMEIHALINAALVKVAALAVLALVCWLAGFALVTIVRSRAEANESAPEDRPYQPVSEYNPLAWEDELDRASRRAPQDR